MATYAQGTREALDGVAGSVVQVPPDVEPKTYQEISSAPADANAVTMLNYGGPLLKHVQVVLIFWGKIWSKTPAPTPSAQEVSGAINALMNGAYMTSLAQYGGIQPGSLIATHILDTMDPPTQFVEKDITGVIEMLIQQKAVPAPTADSDRLYAVVTPVGVWASDHVGDVGYHTWFDYNGLKTHFAWVGNDGTITSDSSALAVFSHELAEACSDPDIPGNVAYQVKWTDGKIYEIGDVCRWTYVVEDGYAVQSYWSQADKACIVPQTRVIDAPGSRIAALHRSASSLDVFAIGSDGITYSANWDSVAYNGKWRGWYSINGGRSAPGGAITAVSRSGSQLDVFVTGSDGAIYTAAWDVSDKYDGNWLGWWPITNGRAQPGTMVSGVARTPHQLDVIVAGTDGGVYTAAWDQNVANGGWRGWWKILDKATVPGGAVTIISRDPNKLDVFMTGADGVIYTAAWDQNVANGNWRGWWPIADGRAVPGSMVYPVSRAANKLDVFIVGTDGAIYTAAWDQNVANGAWQGWKQIAGGQTKPGGYVTAVARDPNKLDVFAVGVHGGIISAGWDGSVANAPWKGWWAIAAGQSEPGAMVSCTSRDPNKLDIFAIGTHGGVISAGWDGSVANPTWHGWWEIPTST